MSQINDFIGWMRKNNRAARAARYLVHFGDDVKLSLGSLRFGDGNINNNATNQ